MSNKNTLPTDPNYYVDCFLSGQIEPSEWVKILKERPDVKECLEQRQTVGSCPLINNILVTGGAGYIGSILVRLLLNEKYKVTVLDRFFFGKDTLPSHDSLTLVKGDIRTATIDVIKGHDAVIDLAAISNDPSSELNPTTTNSINHLGRLRIASLAKHAGVKRYILPSSASIYGFSDEILSEGSVTNPLTTYAEANLNAEKDILSLHDEAFTVTVLRQSTVFGFSQRMRFDLAINGMVKGFLEKGFFPILKDGTQWRPFVHVKDAAQAMELCLRSPREKIAGQIFNVGSDENNYQIFNLAESVAKGLGVPLKYEWYGTPDHRSYKLSFAKIKDVLGFECTHNAVIGAGEIATAIREKYTDPSDPKTITLEWYKKLLEDGVVI